MNTYLSYSKILFDLLNQRTRQETVLLWKSAPFLATSGHKKHVPTKQGPSTSIKEISGLSLCSVSWDASFPVLHQQRQLFPWQHHTVCPFWCFSSAQQNHNRAAAQFDASIRLFSDFCGNRKQIKQPFRLKDYVLSGSLFIDSLCCWII